jgi:hypothetical protein
MLTVDRWQIAPDATAFVHRNETLFCLQYGSVWDNPADTRDRLDDMRQFYASLRPYMPGGAYVNYCDLDLPDYATAYWGENLPQLKQIKAAFDPGNGLPPCPKHTVELTRGIALLALLLL